MWSIRSIEFGARPAESVKPIEAVPGFRFITANAIRFGYIEQGSGPLILLFHGYPETARSWAGVQTRLAAAGFRVVAVSMRGYPPTSFATNGDYTVKALGADVLALIDAFGAANAIVVGHDWGASAIYTAATESPARITALVAMSIPHPRGIAGDPRVLVKAAHFLYYQLPWSSRMVWSHDFAHIDRIYRLWSPNFQPSSDVLDDIKATLRAPGAIESTLGYYWSFFKGGTAGAGASPASSISVPSLIIAGSADGAIDMARFAKARAAFSGPYRFVELDGVGHFPQLEAPDQVADAILSFLATV